MALNRITADTYAADPSLRSLIDVTPFGMLDEPPRGQAPAMRGALRGIREQGYVVCWAGLPIICTSADVYAKAVEREGSCVTVPPGDVDRLAAALEPLALLSVREQYRSNIAAYASRLTCSQAADPLVRYFKNSWRARDLARIARLPTMPMPFRDYSLKDAENQAWEYYAVKATETLVNGGSLAICQEEHALPRAEINRGSFSAK